MKTTHSDIDNKMKTLAVKLGIDAKEIGTIGLSDNNFETDDGEEYLILTDDEADERCAEYIKETLWAFNANFLAAHLKEGIDQEVVELIQSNGKCESNNSAILSLIDDLDHLIDDAIKCDGRGHFLAQYDGDEIELGNDLFAYRIN
jgi:hypothetical protein